MKTRLNLAAIFIITLASVSSFAQNAPYSYGATLGVRSNSASVEGLGTSTVESTFGYHLGGLFFYKFQPALSARTGLIYVDRSIVIKNAGLPPFIPETKSNYKISYLDIPLNAQYSFEGTGFYAFGGFILGLKAGSSCEVASGGGTCTFNASSTNFIFNVGAGYDIHKFDRFTLAAELAYEHGLTDVISDSGIAYSRNIVIGASAKF